MSKTAVIAALAAFICLISAPASASMLRYVDKNGTPHMVDEYEKVPPEYRDQLKGQVVMEEEEPARKRQRPPAWQPPSEQAQAPAAAGAQTPVAAEPHQAIDGGQYSAQSIPSVQAPQAPGPPPVEAPKDAGLFDRIAASAGTPEAGYLFKIGAALIGLLAFLIIGTHLAGSLGHKKLGSLIMIVITLGALFYLGTAHLQKAADNFKAVKKQLAGIQQKAADRNARAENLMLEMQKLEGQARELQQSATAQQAAQMEVMRQDAPPATPQP